MTPAFCSSAGSRGGSQARRSVRPANDGLRSLRQETLISDHGVIPSTLSEVLSQSDFCRCMRCTARVHHHARRIALQQMKKSAVFINTGRGARWTRSADQALQEGWISHGPSTCWKKEPPSHKNPMLSMENVTLTAHVASGSARFDEARKRRVGYELSLVLQGCGP